MIECAVYGCINNSLSTTDPSIQYYYFPKHPEIAKQWITACSWEEGKINPNTASICSIHFDSNSFTTEYKMLDHLGCYTKILKPNAVPTLFLPTPLIILNTQTAVACVGDLAHSHSIKRVNTESQIALQENQRTSEIKQENEVLKRKLDSLKCQVDSLKGTLCATKRKFRDKDREYNLVETKHNFLQLSMMTLQQQKNILSKVFSESQIKILSGKKKIYWSNDDMAVGYTIRHLSNKRCYAYLTKNLNIPLPALSSIKRWATIKKRECKAEEAKT